jgi:hypothetical protein
MRPLSSYRHGLMLIVAGLAAMISAAPAWAQDPAALEPYPLDGIGRSVDVTGPMRCPEVPLVPHAGKAVRWKTTLKVHPAFADRLSAFEEVVAAVATRVYGRAPRRIAHLGSYNCRRIRRYPDLLSEHGIGNAIDVSAFEFPALARAAAKASELPRRLTRAFSVSVLEHWDAEGDDGSPRALHRRFLRELTAALEARPDIFRVMLGPAYPGHANHFHFDCAPYRLVVL